MEQEIAMGVAWRARFFALCTSRRRTYLAPRLHHEIVMNRTRLIRDSALASGKTCSETATVAGATGSPIAALKGARARRAGPPGQGQRQKRSATGYAANNTAAGAQ